MASRSSWRKPFSIIVVVTICGCLLMTYAFIRMAGFQIAFGPGGIPTLEKTATQSSYVMVYPGISAVFLREGESPRGMMVYPQKLGRIDAVLVTPSGQQLKLASTKKVDFESWAGSKEFTKGESRYSGYGVSVAFNANGFIETIRIGSPSQFRFQLSDRVRNTVEWPCNSDALRKALGPPDSEEHGRGRFGSP